MLTLLLTLAAAPAQPAADHAALNPLFRELLDPGLPVGPDVRTKFPAPTMPDGLDAARQREVITQLVKGDYSYDEFTRRSVVAPMLFRLRDASPSDPAAPARGVDVWFVAYGDFKLLDDEKFLERLANAGRGDGKSRTLTPDELARRTIAATDAGRREGYGQIEFDFLDKVRLKLTGRAVWSKTADSAVAAAVVDPRFRGDPEFPNEWRSLTKEAGGVKAGPPAPYGGAGSYLKVTRLAEPPGALFVEQHIVFAEPQGWFDGANLLRSKLRPATEINIRNMRKELLKGK